MTHHPGSPIKEIGADATKRLTRAMPRKGRLRRRGPRTAKIKTPPSRTGFSEGVGGAGGGDGRIMINFWDDNSHA